MIVVAIVGILAAIAIPQYQNYVARSQVSEALSLASGAKTAVAEYANVEGEWAEIGTTTASDGAATINTDANSEYGLAVAASISGRYVLKVAIIANGAIEVTFKGANTDAHTLLQGGKMILTPSSDAGKPTSGAISWTCVDGSGDVTITNYLPDSCQA